MFDSFVGLVIALLIAGGLVGTAKLVTDARDEKTNATRTMAAVSFDHDGHRWVSPRTGNGIAHHPDCRCLRGDQDKSVPAERRYSVD